MNWSQLLTTTRLGQELENQKIKEEDRSQFQRDYDRIIFSSPFRRLQNKTQVFPLPGSVFVHNRLTHSLEVASVGRSLGNLLSTFLQERNEFNPLIPEIGTIVSTACLAHDMGNPPFGHAGEDAISNYFNNGEGKDLKSALSDTQWHDFIHFEGNANALRVLSHQFRGRRDGGYCMTYPTLASIVKYPCNSVNGRKKGNIHRKKYGFFDSEQDLFNRIAEKLGLARDQEGNFKRHPLVFLVEAADDICYNIIDLEDAQRLGILSFEETKSLFLGLFKHTPDHEKQRVEQILHSLREDKNEQLGFLRAKTIGLLIHECMSVFKNNYDSIMDGEFNDSLMDRINPTVLEGMKEIASISFEKIYNHQSVVEIEIAGYKVLGGLIDEFASAVLHPERNISKKLLRLIPKQYLTDHEDIYHRVQVVLDFVSGMTDLYAVDLYKKIKGISLDSA